MFSFEDLQDLESYQEKIEYARKHLNLIGTGRKRTVFDLDEGRVIKFANDEDGIICNNVEKHFSDSGWERLAAVLDFDEDFMWIVSEKAKPIDEKKFQELCNISTEQFYKHLYHYENQKVLSSTATITYTQESNSKDIIEILEQGKNTPISSEINLKSEEMHFNTYDIAFIENLGLIERHGKEMLVIVNYGSFDKRFRKYPLKSVC